MSTARTLIIVKSVHHHNTAKVAQSIADVLQADVVSPQEVDASVLEGYDLVGFGSGIYFGRFHSHLRRWIRRCPPVEPSKPAFVFSTSGLPFLKGVWHWPLKRQLSRVGFRVIGEFNCRGFDTVGPLWLIGGLNRKHPNEKDLKAAAEFARTMLGATGCPTAPRGPQTAMP
jgi:flavodoxin